jgi:YD repeat-containing protein
MMSPVKFTAQPDVLHNLMQVQDQAGDVISMTDPDMGYWQYQYDAAGNLVLQTDARNQVLWFNYDVLNRLTEKRQDGPAGAVLATYTYDQGPTGVGQRTAMMGGGVS